MSSSSDNPETTARKALAALDVRRKALESEAEAITSELMAESPDGGAPMGIDTPLVDMDGYPRGDIDVYRARTLRGRLAEIKTDHKALMKQLDEGLLRVAAFQKKASKEEEEEKAEMAARSKPKPKPKLDPVTGKWVVMNWDGTVAGVQGGEKRSFDNLEATAAPPISSMPAQQEQEQPPPSNTPFARIDAVAANSPAALAGLKQGDLVVQFGTIDHTNHRDLMAISELVPVAAGDQQEIPIRVLRSTSQDESVDRVTKTFTLLPRPWAGRGLLGCHVVKYPITA